MKSMLVKQHIIYHMYIAMKASGAILENDPYIYGLYLAFLATKSNWKLCKEMVRLLVEQWSEIDKTNFMLLLILSQYLFGGIFSVMFE